MTTRLRQRMIENIQLRGLSDKMQDASPWPRRWP